MTPESVERPETVEDHQGAAGQADRGPQGAFEDGTVHIPIAITSTTAPSQFTWRSRGRPS